MKLNPLRKNNYGGFLALCEIIVYIHDKKCLQFITENCWFIDSKLKKC